MPLRYRSARCAQPSAQSRWAAYVTIQELGSLGELIAAVATVATLAYLAVQIRAARQVMRAESRRAGVRENPLLAEIERVDPQAVDTTAYIEGGDDESGRTGKHW